MTPSQSVINEITSPQMISYAPEPVNGTWVADVMSKVFDRQKSFNISFKSKNGMPPVPILIKAPTGTGKTNFIENELTKAAKQNGEYVLLLVNRIALVRQILNEFNERTFGFSLSSDSMNGINKVGNLIVLTYQQFAGDLNTVLNNLKLPLNIRYVVMDEAHFFTSDASFNYQTPNILENIICYSYNKQRIYMSATPEDVKSIILYEENMACKTIIQHYSCRLWSSENLQNASSEYINDQILPQVSAFRATLPQKILEYNFPPRPINCNVKFFNVWEPIINIVNDSSNQEQWLIFVSSKDDGKFLNSKIDNSVFVTAENNSQTLD